MWVLCGSKLFEGILPCSEGPESTVMSKLFLAATLALIPGLALAHSGHPHVGSPLTHHAVEATLVVLAAIAFAWCLRRAGVWGSAKG